MDKIRVASVQYAYKPITGFNDFVVDIEKLLKKARGADFVVFPETFTMELEYIITDFALPKLNDYTEDYIKIFTQFALDYNQFIIAGSHLTLEGDKLYNIAHLFTPGGEIYKHRKTHLFPLEAKTGVSPGERIEVIETEKAKLGIITCYEMEFPEIARLLALKGAEVVFCPSFTVGEHALYRVKYCCQARAVENQVYIVLSSLVGAGTLKELEGWGSSAIMSPCEDPWPPNGIIAEAELNKEQVITGELDLKLLRRKRKRGAATTLKDRRPELYDF